MNQLFKRSTINTTRLSLSLAGICLTLIAWSTMHTVLRAKGENTAVRSFTTIGNTVDAILPDDVVIAAFEPYYLGMIERATTFIETRSFTAGEHGSPFETWPDQSREPGAVLLTIREEYESQTIQDFLREREMQLAHCFELEGFSRADRATLYLPPELMPEGAPINCD